MNSNTYDVVVIGAGAHTEEVNASHAVMISHPATVTHIIEDAARSTR
jgi:hypothetical protein